MAGGDYPVFDLIYDNNNFAIYKAFGVCQQKNFNFLTHEYVSIFEEIF